MRLIRLLKKDLAREMATWVSRDFISVAQARAISASYGVDYDDAQTRSGAYTVLLALGYLFLGVAVIILVGHNWEDIPRAARMGGLVGVTALVHLLGLRQYLRDNVGHAIALFLLGNILYGASIALIAQIYHLGEHMPDGVFWWAVGTMPFAVLLRSHVLMLFTLVLAFIWLCVELQAQFYPAAFPVFVAAAVYVLAEQRTKTTLFLLTVLTTVVWVEVSVGTWWHANRWPRVYVDHVYVTVGLAVLVFGFGHFLSARNDERWRAYGAALRFWTIRLALVVMLLMSFEDPWRALISERVRYLDSDWPLVAIPMTAGLTLAWLAKRGVGTTLTAIVLASLMFAVTNTSDRSDYLVFQIVTNVALVAVGVALTWRGMDRGDSHYFFVGIATVLLTGFLRYVDLIGDYIGGSVLFIVMALVLLGAARLWKHLKQEKAA